LKAFFFFFFFQEGSKEETKKQRKEGKKSNFEINCLGAYRASVLLSGSSVLFHQTTFSSTSFSPPLDEVLVEILKK